MLSQADIAHAMQTLELPDQVKVLEDLVLEHGIAETADVVALFMMNVMMDLDGADYPAELVERASKLSAQVRDHNRSRFG